MRIEIIKPNNDFCKCYAPSEKLKVSKFFNLLEFNFGWKKDKVSLSYNGNNLDGGDVIVY